MKPHEVTTPGRYRWTWKRPDGTGRSGVTMVERDAASGRLRISNGYFLDQARVEHPDHDVTMELVESHAKPGPTCDFCGKVGPLIYDTNSGGILDGCFCSTECLDDYIASK